ncbi:MAG TPA: DUF1501 domain-containing protein [Noviherbaspirillum sp.]|uniref:DUF1501 domain-containing protein n=1 Tax=Noviherbaspirillum sp. TaxID=1926288 RepID=UPI002B47270C|nr:DUF1501 domain-containing protein [Noviherbaspirillum sp.]HJV84065.1 DUF1501 domain-containing protein [Noviherbaspirillum sp.]
MHRRELLKRLAALPLASLSGQLLAVPRAPARLLLVFLRGGYDAASLLIPTGSDFYYDSRPRIAIPRPSNDLNSAIALSGDWGLHPALRDSIYPLFTQRQVAFIPFAGTDNLSRSHFETQDSIELGQGSGHRGFQSGFLNRLASELTNASPMSFTDQLPLVFQGPAQVANMALRNVGRPALDARQSNLIASMYKDSPLSRQVEEGFSMRNDVAREMAGEMEAANRHAINSKGFEVEARRVARLMRDKYSLGFIDVGGWDTHVGQGAATGYLAGRFDELGRGLAALAHEMGPDWRDTVVVVVSEFGRTFRENGNRGTDHGHGTVFWVLGGSVNGGRIAGEQVAVNAASLFQNRDYPVLNEYRAVLAGLFERLYSLNPSQLDRIFPGVRARQLDIV